MSEEQFKQIIDSTTDRIKELLIIKGKEYRNGKGIFHNFEQGAKLTGKTREEVLDGFCLKHLISIDDMIGNVKEGKINQLNIDLINEKFNDVLVYTLLKKASLIDRKNKEGGKYLNSLEPTPEERELAEKEIIERLSTV